MILITGAGGKTGKMLTRVLSTVESVCAFVHHDREIPILKSLGAEKIIVGDMRDEAGVRSAMQGVRAIYHICPNMNPEELVIGNLVIAAARETGVEHFVYHSVLHPQIEKMNHHWQKLRVEEIIFESGLLFTILQPAPYMQNLLTGRKSIIEDGVLRVPYSVHARFSFIDLEDLADAARIVLTEPGHVHAIYELAGTLPMSHAEVAETFGHVLKRKVRAEKEGTGDWGLRAVQSGVNEYAIEHLKEMFEYYDKCGLVGNSNVLRWILKREPTSLRTFIESQFLSANG